MVQGEPVAQGGARGDLDFRGIGERAAGHAGSRARAGASEKGRGMIAKETRAKIRGQVARALVRVRRTLPPGTRLPAGSC
jgi:hypothetical protein